jgi:hypothetical protein
MLADSVLVRVNTLDLVFQSDAGSENIVRRTTLAEIRRSVGCRSQWNRVETRRWHDYVAGAALV